MNKKIMIPIIICLVIIVLIVGILIWNNRTVSIITIDINPSIEINLDRKDRIKKVIALNEDANLLVNDDFKGKSLDDTLNIIVENFVSNDDYEHENDVDIILYSKGNISNEDIIGRMSDLFEDKGINPYFITIDKISKEDKELAKKYNISPAKVAYINSIIDENDNVSMDNLVNRSVSELKETKDIGMYCDEGYMLDGGWCLKEIDRIEAQEGKVCPEGYYEYKGKCYEEKPAYEGDKEVCSDEFELKDGKCIKEASYKPVGECSNGEFISNENICKEKEYVGEGTEYCRDPGRTLYDHKCLATKPSINGGCLNNDMYYNGKCLNPRDDYYLSEYKCPSGSYNEKSEDSKCYKDKKELKPTYTCDEDFELKDNVCVRIEIVNPEKELLCPSGYTKVDFGRCINLKDIKDYEDGLVCDKDNTRLKGNVCIVYDIVEAKK